MVEPDVDEEREALALLVGLPHLMGGGRSSRSRAPLQGASAIWKAPPGLAEHGGPGDFNCEAAASGDSRGELWSLPSQCGVPGHRSAWFKAHRGSFVRAGGRAGWCTSGHATDSHPASNSDPAPQKKA